MFKKLIAIALLIIVLTAAMPAAAQGNQPAAQDCTALNSELATAYGFANADVNAIHTAVTVLCGSGFNAVDLSKMNVVTEGRTDQFTMALATANVAFTDKAGIGNFSVPTGESWMFVSELPTGVIARGTEITGNATGTVMVSFSAEPAPAGVTVRIQAVMANGTLTDVANAVTTSSNSVGRLNGAIHHSLWQEELKTSVPIGYILHFTNPSGATMFRIDHNPSRGNVAVSNIATWTPGQP